VASPFASIKNKLIFAAAWFAWTLMSFKILRDWGYTWQIALADCLVANTLLAIVIILVSNLLRYYRPKKGKYLYIFIICAAKSGLYTVGIRYVLTQIFPTDTHYLNFLNKSLPVRFDIAFLVTICIALMSELWYTLEEQKEREHRQADAEKLAREAELYKLRQQLQPHFLFNSLNSISALVKLEPAQARTMIHQLSDFLRGTLKKEENQWITLEDELQHLQLYLDIEKVRFGHRLNTEIISEASANVLRLPNMMLQPLVENAIKFGLYDTTDSVTIRIQTLYENGYLVISIQNPFDPATSSPKQGTGFGLSSVQRRLYLLFARHDLLVTSNTGNLFTTTIKIPQAP
jgi:two-component system LytT family sensor kinase